MINILLGVGGTGAKVVEAALMLLLAGAGPGKTYVGLVDQDSANGNVARTRILLNNILRFKQAWHRGNLNNALDWSQAQGGAFGAADIEPLFDDGDDDNKAMWCPSRRPGSLKTLVGENMTPEQRGLFDMLFMPGPEEQDLPHDKGYRGRAHVGATALVTALIDEDNRLLKRLRVLMENPGKQPVNIFIVGSAFGGTGAAGFPTLARALHRLRTARDFKNKDEVAIGGLLMLPYFTFNDPEEGGEAVVTSDEILPKTRLALEYYDNLFRREKTFDRFYACGWQKFLPLGYHQDGGPDQANPALPPELIAATAIMDFFSREERPDSEGLVPVMVSARQDTPIRWRDFPVRDLEARFGQMLRFCAYWRYVAEPLLFEKRLFKNWAQKLANGVKASDSETELNSLRVLTAAILEWAATMEHMGGRTFWDQGPWDLTRLCDRAHASRPTRPIALVTSPTEDQLFDAINHLTRDDQGSPRPDTGHAMHDTLSRSEAVAGNHKGIGRVLAQVYLTSGA